MEEKEKLILDFMKDDMYTPMKPKEMAVLLGVQKSDYEEFRKILSKLECELKIRKNKKNRYVVSKEVFVEGVYKRSNKDYGFVVFDNDGEDIYIPKDMNKDALNGDRVLVKITQDKTDGKNQEGEVVKIVKHEKTKLVGIFQDNRNFGFVILDDKKFGTDIFIPKKKFLGAKSNDKVVVKITKYPTKGKKAEGEIIEVIGNVNLAGVDMMSVIREYNLPYEFPESVLEEVKNIPQKINENEIKNRKDLRNEMIFTIDGEDAKDLDDAVSVKKLKSGEYELNVSIADVSFYVKEDSFIDREAILRGTSIYMFDRVIPMLPKELSNGICSLNEGEDRLTLTVTAKIDKNGKIISSDIVKGIINVTKRMNYTDVQKILDKNDEKVLKEYEKYISNFELMAELANILKEKRAENGCLNLDIPESKIIMDKNGKAIDVKKYETTFAHEIIEQFMLTANEIVAERFYWLEAPFIYRVHEDPDSDKIIELNKSLYNFGYKIKGNKENIHPKVFADILEKSKEKPEEKIISNLILHTLKVAKYENECKGHFGLSSKYYCHFTSPIRRYPDLFIHRIISKYLENEYNSSYIDIDKYKLQSEKYSKISSERELVAKKAERESLDIKKAEYMMDKIGNEYEGIVSSVTPFGIFVELENTVEGLIRFENLGDEYYIFNEDNRSLIGERSGTTYKIGDKVNIKVIEANKELKRISFEIYNK